MNNKTLKKVKITLFPNFNLLVVVLTAVSLVIHKYDFPCRRKLVQRVQRKLSWNLSSDNFCRPHSDLRLAFEGNHVFTN